MRVNIYAEELTDRVEFVTKRNDEGEWTGVRFYLELPVTHEGRNVSGPFIHREGDDDSAAVTFWGKRQLHYLLGKAHAMMDARYGVHHDGDRGPPPPCFEPKIVGASLTASGEITAAWRGAADAEDTEDVKDGAPAGPPSEPTSVQRDSYDAGYRRGWRAWQTADPEEREGDPGELLICGLAKYAKRGFVAGWNAARSDSVGP